MFAGHPTPKWHGCGVPTYFKMVPASLPIVNAFFYTLWPLASQDYFYQESRCIFHTSLGILWLSLKWLAVVCTVS